MPDKAIDVIDEVGAFQQLQPTSRRKKMIGVSDVEKMVAKIARIPSASINSNEKESLKDLETNLKMVIFGQSEIGSLERDKASASGLRGRETHWFIFVFRTHGRG